MVVEVQLYSEQLRGHVTAVLCPPGGSSLGLLEVASAVTNNTVVCGYRRDNSEWSLCVWRAWGSLELELFYSAYEQLAHLESTMRRRR